VGGNTKTKESTESEIEGPRKYARLMGTKRTARARRQAQKRKKIAGQENWREKSLGWRVAGAKWMERLEGGVL